MFLTLTVSQARRNEILSGGLIERFFKIIQIIHDFRFSCSAKKWGVGYSLPAPHVPPGLFQLAVRVIV